MLCWGKTSTGNRAAEQRLAANSMFVSVLCIIRNTLHIILYFLCGNEHTSKTVPIVDSECLIENGSVSRLCITPLDVSVLRPYVLLLFVEFKCLLGEAKRQGT